jgi:hypothetical protein
VRPAFLVRVVMGPMTRVLNPVIVKRAGRPGFRMAAQIRHTGRRSGRSYVTPASARLNGDTIVIPLTFGNQSDWVRNIVSAGRCSIRLNDQDLGPVIGAGPPGPAQRASISPSLLSGRSL